MIDEYRNKLAAIAESLPSRYSGVIVVEVQRDAVFDPDRGVLHTRREAGHLVRPLTHPGLTYRREAMIIDGREVYEFRVAGDSESSGHSEACRGIPPLQPLGRCRSFEGNEGPSRESLGALAECYAGHAIAGKPKNVRVPVKSCAASDHLLTIANSILLMNRRNLLLGRVRSGACG
ncbi:MAG: hypothetical protein ACREIA_18245 [Opitutaceae bacterium]